MRDADPPLLVVVALVLVVASRALAGFGPAQGSGSGGPVDFGRPQGGPSGFGPAQGR